MIRPNFGKSQAMLDDALLQEFIHGFYGYGSFAAPWWFIGMEERGGNDEAEIAGRLSAWDIRGCLELEDAAEYHREFGVTKFWQDSPPTQPTWRQLLRLMLTAKLNRKEPVELSQIRQYQRDNWGRHGNETCLLELLPLPSPNAQEWHYNSWTRISQLSSRESYSDWLLPNRMEFIRQQIGKHRPNFVIFYGKRYFEFWQEIAYGASRSDDPNGFSIWKSDATTFVAVPHPRYERTNLFWTIVGIRLAKAGRMTKKASNS